MDDLRLLRDMERGRPLPEPASLARARAALHAAVRDEPHPTVSRSATAAGDRPSRAGSSGRLRGLRRRWVLAGIGAAGVVALGFGALLVVPDAGHPPRDTAGSRGSTGGGAQQPVEAVLVLHRAADAALKLPDTPPRPDQFVYVRSQAGTAGDVREAWISADGTRDSLVKNAGEDAIPIPGCRDGRAAVVKGTSVVPGVTEPCTVRPGYRADLPTDVDAMVAYLNANHSGGKGDANAMGKDVLSLVMESYLRPQQRAALYRAAARIPGLRAETGITDPLGRPGIGISWSTPGKSGQLVFDARDYTFLGVRAGGGGAAVVRVAIVDAVGRRG